VLHDFDVAGFSIFGTLGIDGRRYQFKNEVPIYDIGLRLDDVKAMVLPGEIVTTSGDWGARQLTLEEHGATMAEIGFLRSHRVELNAMTSDQFIAFLERKLTEHGVAKVVPQTGTLEARARRVLEQKLALSRIAQGGRVGARPCHLCRRDHRACIFFKGQIEMDTSPETALAVETLDLSNRAAWAEINRALIRDCGFKIGRGMTDVAKMVWAERKRLHRERRQARAVALAA